VADSDPVEHVDADGTVLEVVTRAEVRARGLRHRATYLAVVDGADRLVVHRRADWKDIYPGFWDVAFGGVCDPGETWQQAAFRELAEEAGLSAADLRPPGLIELGAVDHADEYGIAIGRFYLVRTDAEIVPVDGEVVQVDRIHLDDVEEWAAQRKVSPDSFMAFRQFAPAMR
jgi:8-oxo-dGTP pyrophosphatase MutT (NUDIX family)